MLAALFMAASGYVTSVLSSPDFQTDMMFLSQSIGDLISKPSITNAVGVAGDLASVMIPGVSGGGEATKTAVKGVKSFFKGPGDEVVETGLKGISKVDEVGSQAFSSFSQFKRVVGNAEEGNAWHHIVEQNANNIQRFGKEQIHNTQNLIQLPNEAGSIHRRITGFYNSKRGTIFGLYGDDLVRDQVRKMDFNDQYNFGINVIEYFGGKKLLEENGKVLLR